MRLSDRAQTLDVSRDDIHRERARSPHSRQLCQGSMTQLMEDAADVVSCPKCLREFDVFDTQKNRDQVCPIVPSHLPDHAGLVEVQTAELRKRRNNTPRPY